MTAINKAADGVLSWLLRSRNAQAQRVCEENWQCIGGATADHMCIHRTGWYYRYIYCDGSISPWYFYGCC